MTDRSVWVPAAHYPADGKLRVLLLSTRDHKRSVPVVGWRRGTEWFTVDYAADVSRPLDARFVVVGYQEIVYESHSALTDDELHASFRDTVRTNRRTGEPMSGDAVGWFRAQTAPLIAELVKLRATR